MKLEMATLSEIQDLMLTLTMHHPFKKKKLIISNFISWLIIHEIIKFILCSRHRRDLRLFCVLTYLSRNQIYQTRVKHVRLDSF